VKFASLRQGRVKSVLNSVVQGALLGDHNVYFYRSTKEKHKVLFSSLKAGLDRGCSALYIASGEKIEQAQVEIQNFGLELDKPTKMKILTSYEFYTPDGEFQADRVVEQYRGLIDESLDRGFEGLYVSADAADTFDYLSRNRITEAWLKYEKAFGRTFKFPMEAICAYRTDQIEPNWEVLQQFVQAHENTVTAETANFVNNEKLCKDAISEELNSIFGKEVAQIVLGYLRRYLKIPRNEIPYSPEDLDKALKPIFGRGTTIVNQRILENLRTKLELWRK